MANKNSLAQQLRQTAKIVYRELIGSARMCLQSDDDEMKAVYLLEQQPALVQQQVYQRQHGGGQAALGKAQGGRGIN